MRICEYENKVRNMPYFHYNQTQRHRYYGQFFTSLALTSFLNSTRLIRTPRDMISTLLILAVHRMHVRQSHEPSIWPNMPRVLQSLIAQCLVEHSTGVRGLSFFLCPMARDMLITSFISSPSLKFNIFLYIWHLVNTDTFYATLPAPFPECAY